MAAGSLLGSFAFDPELDLLYVSTGNGSPWNWKVRSPGVGIICICPASWLCGRIRGNWSGIIRPRRGIAGIITAVQQMILTTLSIGGRDRKVLMQAPKNGFFYVLDRATGSCCRLSRT